MLILGIIASALKKAISDLFTRTTSGSLGNATSGQGWTATRGTWFANGSQAQSNDSASTYPIASIPLGENVTASASVSGGTGVSFWVTDANSWWATISYNNSYNYNYQYSCTVPCCTSYSCCNGTYVTGQSSQPACSPSIDTQTTSYTCYTPVTVVTYPCNSSVSASPVLTPEGPNQGDRCGNGYTTSTSYSYSCSGLGSSGFGAPASVACNQPSHNGGICNVVNEGGGFYSWDTCIVTTSTTYAFSYRGYSSTTTCTGGPISTNSSWSGCGGCTGTTTTTTTYKGYLANACCSGNCSTTCTGTATAYEYFMRLIRSVSGTVSTVTSDISLGSQAAAIWIQTSGNTITSKAYSNTTLTSQIGSTLTHNATSPTKGSSVGIIKAPSNYNQGSTVDDFSATI